ncbi:Uncharacterized protein PECH_006602 [Penicillium ucsense]|uniref:Lariat debranching enzyme C-terminal domain-containing protein n=1 Tax=Penicillium ucsense TaxID=2839758 RepID=A0A8J8WLA0_9EURO|nr:Uncharacterized protein PECM_004017 [Penicillium ucsense]KAF7735497.1 Uncharacterized protein PECH_006602 [Penicillium ucsense]
MLSEMDGVRVAAVGCAHGSFDEIYELLKSKAEAKGWETIDLVIIGGDFQALRNTSDAACISVPAKWKSMGDFHKYYGGEKVAPYLTIFCGGNHEASNYLFELYYGGWVAPNIYYLGAANLIRFGPLRISAMSGIWKGYDYRKPHFERLPYGMDDLHSIYHVRELDVRKLLQVHTQVDVGLSHDWPRGIENFGNSRELFRKKRGFKEDSEHGTLGSVAARDVLDHLRPAYWFAAHLHVKFAAVVPHDGVGIKKTDAQQGQPPEWAVEADIPAGLIESKPRDSVAERIPHVKPLSEAWKRGIAEWNAFAAETHEKELKEAEENQKKQMEFQLKLKEMRERGPTTVEQEKAAYLALVTKNSDEISLDSASESHDPPSGNPSPVKDIKMDMVSVGGSNERKQSAMNCDVLQASGLLSSHEDPAGETERSPQNRNSTAVASSVDASNDEQPQPNLSLAWSVPGLDDQSEEFKKNVAAWQQYASDGNKAYEAEPEADRASQEKRRQFHTKLMEMRKQGPTTMEEEKAAYVAVINKNSDEISLGSASETDDHPSANPSPVKVAKVKVASGDGSNDWDESSPNWDVLRAPAIPTGQASSADHNDSEIDALNEELRSKLPASFARPTPQTVKSARSKSVPEAVKNKVTRFLALDKPHNRDEVVDLMKLNPISETSSGGLRLQYDREWLAITRVFAKELILGDRTAQTSVPKGDDYYRASIAFEEAWVEENIEKRGLMDIPLNFQLSAPKYDPSESLLDSPQPREYPNNQTAEFCALLQIPNKFALTEEEIEARIRAGPSQSSGGSFHGGSNHRGRGQGRGRGRVGGRGNGRGFGRGRGRARGQAF